MKHFITAFLLLFLTQGLSAQKHYVRHNAAGMNNGATWYDAFTSLHAALQQAQYGDTIWVAAGTYYPSDTTSRDATFLLPNGVRLFGGFSGIENLLTERDIQLYPAILSGDIGLPGDASDNCYNVLTCHDADSTTVLDGFIIQDGNANSTSFSDPLSRKRGGGMYLKPTITGHETSPEIRHCIFRNNYASSGTLIFAEGNNQGAAVPDLIYCKFEQNPGTVALFYFLNHPGSHVIKVRHTVFNNNSMVMQHLRGAVGVLIENDTFSNSGGGANITFSGTEAAGVSTVTIRNSLFYNNTWGKIFLDPNPFLDGHHFFIENCKFIDNQIFETYSESAKIIYTNNYLIDNERLDFRIYQPVSFDHNIFRQTDFLALRFYDITSCRNNLFHRIGYFNWELYSGADTAVVTQNCMYQANMSVSLTQARFEYCSFIDVGNTADTFNIFRPSKNITLNSCIFSGYQSTPPLIDTLTAPGQWARAVNCVFETPCEGVLYDADTLVCNGSNVFGVAPMFRDTAGGDFRLLPCSPGINMGDTAVLAAAGISTDLGGAPRVANGMPDAGAFETLLAIRRDTLIHASCDGVANGRVVYGVEACPPFEYQWINGSGMSGTQVDHLAGGQYVVTVTGQHGLILTDTFTIESTPVDLLLNAALTPASSSASSDGAIVVEAVSGGTGPYQYAWSTGGTEYYIELVPAGAYSLTVTDSNGCTEVFTYDLMVSGVTLLPQEELHIRPNPICTGGRLFIEGETLYYLQLYDISGRSVAQEYGRSLTIPTSLPAGMYLLNAQDALSGVVRKGLVVVR